MKKPEGTTGELLARPFVKWAGGKRQLVGELRKSIPEDFFDGRHHYYEPFVGGGALFFSLRASGWNHAATLGDANERLMRTYLGVKDDVEAVIEALGKTRYEKKFYLRERARPIDTAANDFEVAAWFIYLNKAGFNGLYRVNKDGGFNVPFGDYDNPTLCDAPGLRAASHALKKTKLVIGDFEKAVKSAEAGDLVYCDPPYVPVSATSDFTSYTKEKFGPVEQERLRDMALRLKRLGVHVILSNADVPFVRKLYKGFNIRSVSARRNINSKGGSRGAVGEVIIT